MADKALDGVKVLEFADFISGPYCTKLMADLGAEVIKIEQPGCGDEARRHGPFLHDIPHPERSGLFLFLNTNKLGITLNPETHPGREIFKKLIKEIDVLVENNPPLIMQELGLDYETLKELNPHLIMTSITPFGQSGPYRDYKAYAINCSAAGGMSNTIGKPDREPLTLPLSQGHYQSGALGATATMTALLARELTGQGQHVDISEAEAWAMLHTGYVVHSFVFDGKIRIRAGHRVPAAYPYAILPCKDGYMSITAIRGYQWKAFLELMGGGQVPEWYSKDPRFQDRYVIGREYADEMDAMLAPWLMARTKEEIFTSCQERAIPFTPVKSIDEVVNNPHLNERNYFVEVDHKQTGPLKYPGAPFRFYETPWAIDHPAPLLGEHNEEIYCKRLGYSKQDLVDFRRGGVI